MGNVAGVIWDVGGFERFQLEGGSSLVQPWGGRGIQELGQWDIHFQFHLNLEVTLPDAFRPGMDGPQKQLARDRVPGCGQRRSQGQRETERSHFVVLGGHFAQCIRRSKFHQQCHCKDLTLWCQYCPLCNRDASLQARKGILTPGHHGPHRRHESKIEVLVLDTIGIWGQIILVEDRPLHCGVFRNTLGSLVSNQRC